MESTTTLDRPQAGRLGIRKWYGGRSQWRATYLSYELKRDHQKLSLIILAESSWCNCDTHALWEALIAVKTCTDLWLHHQRVGSRGGKGLCPSVPPLGGFTWSPAPRAGPEPFPDSALCPSWGRGAHTAAGQLRCECTANCRASA